MRHLALVCGPPAAGRSLLQLIRAARPSARILAIASSPAALRAPPAPSPEDLSAVSPDGVSIWSVRSHVRKKLSEPKLTLSSYAPDTNALVAVLLAVPDWPLSSTNLLLQDPPTCIVLVDPCTICNGDLNALALCISLASDAADRSATTTTLSATKTTFKSPSKSPLLLETAVECDLIVAVPADLFANNRPSWIHTFNQIFHINPSSNYDSTKNNNLVAKTTADLQSNSHTSDRERLLSLWQTQKHA